MIDEYLESKIDKLCEAVPRYWEPRMVRFCATWLGWRIYLYASAVRRGVVGTFANIREMNDKMTEEDLRQLEEEAIDPEFADLEPEAAKAYTKMAREEREKTRQMEKARRRKLSLLQRFKEWRADSKARGEARDKRWAAREAAADARAQERMQKAGPLIRALLQSRFPFMLLMTLLAALGVCAVGGHMGYAAASCCVMWLVSAFETEYRPVCGGVKQRYLAQILLRAAASLLLLPMYFLGYMEQGVYYNLLLQSAMLVLLFAHAVFYLPLVAFNFWQPLYARVLSGVLGAVPALTASAAITCAVTRLALPAPLPLAAIVGAAGALLAFSADRLMTITELGGIRLRYTPVWVSAMLEIGYLLILAGAWLSA